LHTLKAWQVNPNRYIYRQMDMTGGNAVSLVVGEAIDLFPDLDTVPGHAGGCGLHPFTSTPQAEFDRIFQFNYVAQTYLARAVLALTWA
jgi:NAD(P)-dependent dehydrogenase (short-subunit alcohol dehydrogenase family)